MSILLGLLSQISDKTVANTTVETSLLNLVVPTNNLIPDYFTVGRNLDFRLRGYASNLKDAPLIIRVKIDGVTVGTTGIVGTGPLTTNYGWLLCFGLTIRTIGVSGTVRGQGYFRNNANGNLLQLTSLTDSIIDTTVNDTLDVTAQWSNANAGNSITCTNIFIGQI